MINFINKIDNKIELPDKTIYMGDLQIKGFVNQEPPVPIVKGVKVITKVGNWTKTEDDGTNTIYESYRFPMPNAVDRIRIEMENIKSLSFGFRSDGEHGEDYMCIGDLDVDFSTLYSADQITADTVGVKYDTRYTPSQTDWDYTLYPNDGGKHFVDIVYRKNGNNNVGLDKAWLKFKNTDLIK